MHDEVQSLKAEILELKAAMFDSIKTNQQMNETLNYLVQNLVKLTGVPTENGNVQVPDIINAVSEMRAKIDDLESPAKSD